ncbi:MAG: hypothetical protein GXY38_09570 [Planctomycetes bacterium]|jgi:L-fucose isomerase-like protein|nr:hypothetical protein [Planctomycetota bacterium]
MRSIKAAFVAFAEVNTPREFIDSRSAGAAKLLEEAGIDLLLAPIVTDDSEGSAAAKALEVLAGKDFDVLILCIAGWIPSWAVLKVIEPFKHIPMVLWGLSGWREGKRFITTADQAGTTALRHPMREMGYTFKYIVTYREQAPRVEEILAYATAARAVRLLKDAKLGMAGYRDMKLYGTMYDGAALKKTLGMEIEHFELLELDRIMNTISPADVEKTAGQARSRWKFLKEPQPGTLEKSVKLYLALRKKIEDRGYQAISYSDVDGIKKLLGFAPAGAMTLLHENMDISSVPENDALGMVTQMIVRSLTGQAGAYLEFYEFMQDGALMGVPDYVPAEIVDGPITVLPNAFGSFGEGLLNVSKLKTGMVTLARLSDTGGRYVLHVATADAASPVSWEEAGWAPPAPQLPSLDMTFHCDAEDFIQNVMSQHYMISYGDNVAYLRDFCDITGMTLRACATT